MCEKVSWHWLREGKPEVWTVRHNCLYFYTAHTLRPTPIYNPHLIKTQSFLASKCYKTMGKTQNTKKKWGSIYKRLRVYLKLILKYYLQINYSDKMLWLWKSHRKTCGARLLSITYMNIKMLTSFSSPSKKGPGQHVNWHARRPQEPFPQVNTVKCSEHAGEGEGRVVKPAKASHAVQYWSEAFWQCHKGKWGCFKVRNFLNWKQIIPPHILIMFFLP